MTGKKSLVLNLSASGSLPDLDPKQIPPKIRGNPTEILKQVFLGFLPPPQDEKCMELIRGAVIEFGYRPGEWRNAVADRIVMIGKHDIVLVLNVDDIEPGKPGYVQASYGSREGCWRFRLGEYDQ